VGGWGSCFLSGKGHFVCLHWNVCQRLIVIHAYIYFTSCEVARTLFATVSTFRSVLLWFVASTGGLVSAAFDTFWGEIATLSLKNEVLTSVALERTAQSNIIFCVYLEVEESCATCILFHCRGKNRELISRRFSLYIVRLTV
jgi:hypothetical protein